MARLDLRKSIEVLSRSWHVRNPLPLICTCSAYLKMFEAFVMDCVSTILSFEILAVWRGRSADSESLSINTISAPTTFYPTRGETESGVRCQITGDDKQLFIKFMRRMLAWDPAERATAKELLCHPWLYERNPEIGTQ